LEKGFSAEKGCENSDIAQITELQHKLDHPQRLFLEVAGRQILIREEPSDLLNNEFSCRLLHPTWPRLELDHEIAVECGGQLAERRDLEP